MKRNQKINKAARRAKTRPQWEAQQAKRREEAAAAARANQAFNPVMVDARKGFGFGVDVDLPRRR